MVVDTIAAFRGHEVVGALSFADFIVFLFFEKLTHTEVPKFGFIFACY